jgi:hypothetical protein
MLLDSLERNLQRKNGNENLTFYNLEFFDIEILHNALGSSCCSHARHERRRWSKVDGLVVCFLFFFVLVLVFFFFFFFFFF